jgi:tetraacyldisaccharide 4'-kinase
MDIGKLQRRFTGILSPASRVYAAFMQARAFRYATRGLAFPFRAKRPVISVGNIAWGGTGKTPVVEYLLTKTAGEGLTSVVLTRGYKASAPELPFAVSPGEENPLASGDEPLLLARRHPEALVMVDPRRRRAAAWAEKNARPDLFLLDDGMQHLDIARDLDIVLLRPEDLLDQWNKVIPAGSWREGKSALGRAHAFCLKADLPRFTALSAVAGQRLAAYGRPLFSFHLAPSGLERLVPYGKALPETRGDLGGTPYTLVCGTADPGQVAKTATDFLGYPPAETRAFPDHHRYTAEDVRAFCSPSRPVVCTAKDAVKLAAHLAEAAGTPIWVLGVSAVFGPSLFLRQTFDEWWLENLRRLLRERTEKV